MHVMIEVMTQVWRDQQHSFSCLQCLLRPASLCQGMGACQIVTEHSPHQRREKTALTPAAAGRDKLELLLALGASRWEASADIRRSAVGNSQILVETWNTTSET